MVLMCMYCADVLDFDVDCDHLNNVHLDGVDVDGDAAVYVAMDVVYVMKSVKAKTEKTAVIVSDLG
jgi:hypothetical protein